jgi:hypothetical protein
VGLCWPFWAAKNLLLAHQHLLNILLLPAVVVVLVKVVVVELEVI